METDTNRIAEAREWLAQADRPVSFSGAGLSAESGIATFRDPEGVWAQVDPAKMATPQGFEEDPESVISWYNSRRDVSANARPNPGHQALASDEHMIHITQNIDGLLEAAGARNVLHLHGTITRDRCHAGCGFSSQANRAGLYGCSECGGLMRPDVVWFGEMLPQATWMAAEDAALKSDVMLVIGTSAAVYPAAGLIEVAIRSGSRLIVVNAEPLNLGVGLELVGDAGDLIPQILRSGQTDQ